MKRVLVTAGNTMVPIDQVRMISNIFRGRTGSAIATYLAAQGLEVTLLTSHPELVTRTSGLEVVRYQNFWDLYRAMEERLAHRDKFDAVVHSAAISDYEVDGVFTIDGENSLVPVDATSKISSDHQRLFLGMKPTPKIVDQIRRPWGFGGTLVKFKLQVGISDEELIKIATKSMHHSGADYIVANCLEWSRDRAYIIGAANDLPVPVSRRRLPEMILRRLL